MRRANFLRHLVYRSSLHYRLEERAAVLSKSLRTLYQLQATEPTRVHCFEVPMLSPSSICTVHACAHGTSRLSLLVAVIHTHGKTIARRGRGGGEEEKWCGDAVRSKQGSGSLA